MPCLYRIFAEENLVARTYSGRITYRCVLKLLDEIEDDKNYRDGMLEFDDLRNVNDMAITATDIARFADLITGLNTRKRRPTKKAILAPDGPGRAAAFGFSILVENVKGLEVGIFDDFAEAARFLGLPVAVESRRLFPMVELTVH